MVILTKKEAYEKQIALYLNNREYEKAYLLSKEFSEKFKDEMTPYFLLMKSAFRMKKFDEAIIAGRHAFNKSEGQDTVICAVILSSAYYLNGDNKQCYDLLAKMKLNGSSDIEKLMFIYSLTAKDEKEAMAHIDNLYRINPRLAEDFIMKFL